jgi:hypothetical protein
MTREVWTSSAWSRGILPGTSRPEADLDQGTGDPLRDEV